MSEELKYCKFCDKEKPIKEFCKSGFAIKNKCKQCANKEIREKYRNAKRVEQLELVLDEIREQLKLERKLALSLNKPYTISVIDKLLDKVGKEWN